MSLRKQVEQIDLFYNHVCFVNENKSFCNILINLLIFFWETIETEHISRYMAYVS